MSAFGTKRTRVISPLMSALTRSGQIGPLVGAQIEIKLMTRGRSRRIEGNRQDEAL